MGFPYHERLKELREDRNMSIEDLSLYSGVTEYSIESFEEWGNTLSNSEITDIANALNMKECNLRDELEYGYSSDSGIGLLGTAMLLGGTYLLSRLFGKNKK